MLLRLGDKNERVAEIQKLLSLIGYDLIVDGHFGARTQRSVKAFQKRAGLSQDGLVGQNTYSALQVHASQKRAYKDSKEKIHDVDHDGLEINRNHRLSSNQYIKQKTEKSQIFLHFTAGSASARNVIDYWESDAPRVSTAYVVAGDGEVFECFHPDYWGYHLGIKGTNGRLDKASVGIEICNYGPLQQKDGKFYAWPNNYSSVVIPENRVYKLNRSFRGFQYFEAFQDAQIYATEKLCESLIKKYDIKVQYDFDQSWFDYNSAVVRNTLPGIWTHTTVRRDKSDIYPDHRMVEMLNRLANKYGR